MSKHDVALVSSFPVIQASQGRIQDFLMGSGGGGGGGVDRYQLAKKLHVYFILSCPTFAPRHGDLETTYWRVYCVTANS